MGWDSIWAAYYSKKESTSFTVCKRCLVRIENHRGMLVRPRRQEGANSAADLSRHDLFTGIKEIKGLAGSPRCDPYHQLNLTTVFGSPSESPPQSSPCEPAPIGNAPLPNLPSNLVASLLATSLRYARRAYDSVTKNIGGIDSTDLFTYVLPILPYSA